MSFAIPRRSFLASLLATGLANRGFLTAQTPEQPAQPVGPPKIDPLSDSDRVRVDFSEIQQFGISCPRLPDPSIEDRVKMLTGTEQGHTNNTIVRVGGADYFYGRENPGFGWVTDREKVLKGLPIPGKDKQRSWMSVWEINSSRIRVTQSVEIIVGEQTRLYDTVLVKYEIWNRDKAPHPVGLRVLLDTFIGNDDGQPFYIPPTETKPAYFVQKMDAISAKNVPSYIQALESPDLRDSSSALAVLGLRVRGAEPVEKLVICRWPQIASPGWGGTGKPKDWAYKPMGDTDSTRNSCVLLYWPESPMKPDERRELAFTYGLGRVMSDLPVNHPVEVGREGKLRLFTAPGAVVNKPFPVAAYVRDRAGTKVNLKVPDGLTLVEGDDALKTSSQVTLAGYGQASWLLAAEKPGKYILGAELYGRSPRETAREIIEVRETSRLE